MYEKKVSVIIPTYKRKSITKTIDSVLSQNYDNLEIIVVDDNAEYQEFRNYIIDDVNKIEYKDKIKLILNKKNLGGALSRNVGIENSIGEYIAFLDNVDIYLSNKISKQVERLEKSKADICYCRYKSVDKNGNVLWENKKSKEGNC